ncbi:MAG: tetratricopeptide repeat protein, partial [Planctomycetota bacterium]
MQTSVVQPSSSPTPDLPKKSLEENITSFVFSPEQDSHSKETVSVTQASSLLSDIQKASEESASKKAQIISEISENRTLADLSKTDPSQSEEKTLIKVDVFFETEEGRYQILELLGEGGMGIVQGVRDHLLEREVAVKRIKINNKNRSTVWEEKIKRIRLQREAMLMAYLEHPNIVPLYEMQKSPTGDLQFTMRKVQGGTLRALFREARLNPGRFSEDFFLSIFLKVCDAISYAHSRSVVHRDLKPDNIMVGSFGEVYVMDWGIAKRLNIPENSDLSSSMEPSPFDNLKTIGGLGTPGYMPPEQQANASTVLPQADIYSLGKLLRECYIYYSPIEELKMRIDYTNKLRYKKTLPSDNPFFLEIPKDIQAIVEKATKLAPEGRYSSVKAFMEDIGRYRQHTRVSARNYSVLEMLRLWKQRHRKKIIAAVTFSISVLSFFFYFRYEKKREDLFKFRTALDAAKLKEAQGDDLDKSLIALKIKSLLQGLSSLNVALSLFTGEAEAEDFKAKLGQKLINLACNTGNYEMADYLFSELQLLSCLTTTEKNAISEKIEEQQTRQLKRNQKRLSYWENRFRTHQQEEGDSETALFEISKMKEKEILQRLQEILKESVDYYEQTEKRNISQNEFYSMMMTALGRSESLEIGSFIRPEMLRLANHLLKIPLNQRPKDKIQFLIILVEVLGNLQEKKALPTLIDIALTLKQGDFFEKKIESVIRKLATLEAEDLRWQDPPDVVYHYQALFCYYQKNYPDALKKVQKAIDLNPSQADYYNTSGLMKQLLGQWEEAQKDLAKAIQLNPQCSSAYANRGRGKLIFKDYEGSIQDLEKAISLDPRELNFYLYLSETLCTQKKYANAIQLLKRGIEAIPQSSRLSYHLALLFMEQKEWEEALNILTIAIQQDPYFADAYLNRGKVYTELGELEKALDDYSFVVQINPTEENAYLNRSIIKIALQDWEGALQDCTYVLKKDPQSFEAYNALGSYYSAQGNIEEAIEHFN